jgi:prevent-host-death family protein
MQTTPFPVSRSATNAPHAWRLQDAKSQFSALVDNALRGVPQHVTRRGKQAVVVLSEQDFEALPIERPGLSALSSICWPCLNSLLPRRGTLRA